MTDNQAEQIAKLLNDQNRLARQYDRDAILQRKECFIMKEDTNGSVIGAVEVVKVQCYQAEIKHLSVSSSQQRKGVGRDLLTQAERKAIETGARIAQCTIRDDNTASIRLFLSSGYKHTVTFVNRDTGNRVMVLQKLIQ
jgi:ribosomal protein S18 acetylase RimI-like enzyme